MGEQGQEGHGGIQGPHCILCPSDSQDKDPEELLARIIHEWQHSSGILLRIKELQSFESETVLTLFNICTVVPKKFILDEFLTILMQAQS